MGITDSSTKRTTIIIAHRLSTVRNADKIVVLGNPEGTSTAVNGSVILEEGSHDELMAIESGFYKAMVGVGEKDLGRGESMSLSESAVNLAAMEKEVEIRLTDEMKTSRHDEFKDGGDQEAEADQGCWAKLCGGKKKTEEELEKEKAEKEETKYRKSRVWNYTKPELSYIIIGSISSMIKGTVFPLLSLVFSEMIIVWFGSDTDVIRQDSLNWSYFFYGLAVVSFVSEFIQKYFFEIVGEKLTTRLRSDTFRGMLQQDVTWFEDDKHSIGTLSSHLATDVKFIRLVAGQSLAATLETVSSLITGIIIALIASWEIFLILLAIVPILGVSEMLNMKMLMGSENDIRGEMTTSTNSFHETINGIREVQAFALQNMIAADIKTRIFDTIGPSSKKAAIMKGFMMGLMQAVPFCVYALAFWAGGELIEIGRVDFEAFNKALWAMAFAASGLGQAALFAGDAAKASAALNAIFGILDHKSPIRSEAWENDGLADPKSGKPEVREVPETDMLQGSVNLTGVNFSYPTRKAAKIFDEIDLDIPSGKVVALVGSSGSGKSSVIQLLERFYDPIRYREEKNDEKTVFVAVKEGNGVVSIDKEDMKKSDCRWLRS